MLAAVPHLFAAARMRYVAYVPVVEVQSCNEAPGMTLTMPNILICKERSNRATLQWLLGNMWVEGSCQKDVHRHSLNKLTLVSVGYRRAYILPTKSHKAAFL